MKSRSLWMLCLGFVVVTTAVVGCKPTNAQQTQKIEDLQKQVKELQEQVKEAGNPEDSKPPQRYGMVIGVKPEKLDYYKELHANPWPSVNEQIRKSNIQNYSIYLTQFDDGKWYLFAYFEYTGNNFEGDMKKMGEDAETIRWWKETDPCQIPLENRKEGEWWKKMEEVYRLK